MTTFLNILHVLVSIFLILIVLAQQGKGQDLASAFGGGGSSAAFGARGTATLLSKITTGAAVLFMVTSLGLSYLRPVMSQRTVVPAGAPGVEAPQETVPVSPEGEQPPGEEATPGTDTETTGESPEAPPEGEQTGEESQPDPQ